MVRVPVIKAFTHEGRAFNAGDTIEVTPLVAAVLHRRGFVSLTKGYDAKGQAAEDAPLTSARRRYRRKDLVAE